MKQWLLSLRSRGLGAKSAVLGLVVLAVYVPVAPFAALHRGLMGMAAAALGALFCWLGAECGLLICGLFQDPKLAAQGMLLGMLPRMAIPIGMGLAVQLLGGPLAEAGVLVYLVVFYPVTLSVETVLCLPANAPTTRPGP